MVFQGLRNVKICICPQDNWFSKGTCPPENVLVLQKKIDKVKKKINIKLRVSIASTVVSENLLTFTSSLGQHRRFWICWFSKSLLSKITQILYFNQFGKHHEYLITFLTHFRTFIYKILHWTLTDHVLNEISLTSALMQKQSY